MNYVRLVLALIVLLAFVGVGAAAYKYRGDAIEARADAAAQAAALNEARDTNAFDQETIRRLNAQIMRNDEIVSGLNSEIRQINSALTFSNNALSDLKASHEDVRAYLDTPVPDALRSLYDGAKAGGGGSHRSGQGKRAGRAAGAPAAGMER